MSRYGFVPLTALDKFGRMGISAQSGSSMQIERSAELSCDSGDSTLRRKLLPNARDGVMELVTEKWVSEQFVVCYQSAVVNSAADKELRQERRNYDRACKSLNGKLRDQREDLRRYQLQAVLDAAEIRLLRERLHSSGEGVEQLSERVAALRSELLALGNQRNVRGRTCSARSQVSCQVACYSCGSW